MSENLPFYLISRDDEVDFCIANNIPYKFFRLGVESKGLLTAKGGLYVGTGRTVPATVTVDGGTVYTCDIPVTVQLAPPSQDDGITYILTCVNGELKWVEQTQQ